MEQAFGHFIYYGKELPSHFSYNHFICDFDNPGSILVRSLADDLEKEILCLYN